VPARPCPAVVDLVPACCTCMQAQLSSLVLTGPYLAATRVACTAMACAVSPVSANVQIAVWVVLLCLHARQELLAARQRRTG